MEHSGADKKAELKAAREAQLVDDLAVVDRWMHDMSDPEEGDVGKKLRDAVAGSTLAEKPDMDFRLNAVFNSFAYPPKPGERGLKNELVYGLPALDSKSVLLGARCHEMVHAEQYRKAVAAHAHPFNEAAPFFLSPQDYMRMKEALEQDAYAKGAWLQSLATHQDGGVAGALDHTPLPVRIFAQIRKGAGDLATAFKKAASYAGARKGKWLADNSVTPARDLWHENAIMEYARVMKVRIKNGQKDFKFVRLEETDLAEIGAAFGPCTFDGNLAPKLSPLNQARLDAVNALLGVGKHEDLQTLTDALAKENLTRSAFVEKSYTYTAPHPLTK